MDEKMFLLNSIGVGGKTGEKDKKEGMRNGREKGWG